MQKSGYLIRVSLLPKRSRRQQKKLFSSSRISGFVFRLFRPSERPFHFRRTGFISFQAISLQGSISLQSRCGPYGAARYKNRWASYPSRQGKRYHLGYYDTKEEAVFASNTAWEFWYGSTAILAPIPTGAIAEDRMVEIRSHVLKKLRGSL